MSDGKSLLLKVKESFPNIIRVILGGNQEETIILEAIQKNIARTSILKPWEQNILMFCNKIFQTKKDLRNQTFFPIFKI